MGGNPLNEHSLSSALNKIYQEEATDRLRRFFLERFFGDKQNVIQQFQQICDGMFTGSGFEKLPNSLTKPILLYAAHADYSPTKSQVKIIATAYSTFLMNAD